jgi:2-oxoisovalerate dehydrogenase E1 component
MTGAVEEDEKKQLWEVYQEVDNEGKEKMFGDFISLCFDQILNHASKYHQMYAGQKNIPLIGRTPMGGRRGYGPTHSQSLEKYIIGIPNIQVIALSLLHNPIVMWDRIIRNTNLPTVVIEDKKTYAECLYVIKNGRYNDFFVSEENDAFLVIRLTFDPDENARAVIITYGASLQIVVETANKIMLEDEIMVDIIVNTSIAPLHYDYIIGNIKNIDMIITLEEGTGANSIGSEIISRIAQNYNSKQYVCISAENTVIPCNKELEISVLPNADKIIRVIKEKLHD